MSKEFDKRYAKIPNRKSMTDIDKSVVSKLVNPTNTTPGLAGRDKELSIPDFSIMSRVAHRTASNVTDARNMFQVLPDMDLARQIMVSAIISPTDLTSSVLLYSLKSTDLDSNLTGPMLRKVQDYFTKVYKINELLPTILDDALFMKGSYPLMVLPESTIDHAINSTGRVSLESVKGIVDDKGWYRPIGILGPSVTQTSYGTALEGFGQDVNFSASLTKSEYSGTVKLALEKKTVELKGAYSVTDNPNILKNPMLIDRLRKQRIGDIYGINKYRIGMESKRSKTDRADAKNKNRQALDDIQRTFYLNRQYSQLPLQPLLTPRQLDKENVGHPMVMHLPPEAVIPVHVPGDPRQHVGYFILLDVNGNPVSLAGRDDFYSDIRSSMAKNPDMASHLLNMTRRATYGREDWNSIEINEMARNYGQIVEQDLLNRLRNGAMSGDYEFSRTEEINRLMFSRALSQKNTMMLFVPVELMVYVAFDYNEFGIGKSLLEDGKILASVRATLLFANTMAAVKNATGTQTINIELPPDDQDPYGTVEFMLNMYAKLNREGFPIGDTHPADLINHLQNAGKNIAVTGHPAFPEVKFDIQSRDGSHKEINTELEEMLRKRHIQMFGLTPEVMEAAAGADFATQVVNNFLMLLKRVVQYQKEVKPFIEDIHRKYILNSSFLLEELKEIVKENKKFLPKEFSKDDEGFEEFVYEFVTALEIDLPSPETNRLKEQMEAFDAYSQAITTAIDAYFSEEMLDSTAAQSLHESVPTTKAALIAHFRRKWLRENAVLPELDIFGTMEEEETPALNLLEEMDNYNEGLLASVEAYMQRVHKAAIARKKRLDKENGTYDEAMNGGDDMGGGEDDGAGDGAGDDFGAGGGDDGGFDDGGMGGEGGDDMGGDLGDLGGNDGGDDLDPDAGSDETLDAAGDTDVGDGLDSDSTGGIDGADSDIDVGDGGAGGDDDVSASELDTGNDEKAAAVDDTTEIETDSEIDIDESDTETTDEDPVVDEEEVDEDEIDKELADAELEDGEETPDGEEELDPEEEKRLKEEEKEAEEQAKEEEKALKEQEKQEKQDQKEQEKLDKEKEKTQKHTEELKEEVEAEKQKRREAREQKRIERMEEEAAAIQERNDRDQERETKKQEEASEKEARQKEKEESKKETKDDKEEKDDKTDKD